MRLGLNGRRTAFSHLGSIRHFPYQYVEPLSVVMGVGSQRGDQPSGLSDPCVVLHSPWSCTATRCIETSDDSGRPLFALASSVRSRLKPERCRGGGLRTFLYASLMPPQNPIDFWDIARSEKTKKPLRQTPLRTHPKKDGTPKGVGVWLNGFYAWFSGLAFVWIISIKH